MGRMSDLNDLPRSHDVTDPTTCAWPAQEIAAAEAPVTAGTDRYMRAAAHAVARAALRELRQGTQGGPQAPGTERNAAQAVITPAQRAEIDKAREEILATRQQLRAVQLELRRDIERLQTWVKVLNIAAVPVLLTVFAIVLAVLRSRRRVSARA